MPDFTLDDIIDLTAQQSPTKVQDAVNQILGQKSAQALESMKSQLAQSLYGNDQEDEELEDEDDIAFEDEDEEDLDLEDDELDDEDDLDIDDEDWDDIELDDLEDIDLDVDLEGLEDDGQDS